MTTACANAKIPTPNTKGAWPYASVGGAVRIATSDMAAQPHVWRKFATYSQSDMCTNPLSLTWASKAVHWCSYSCALTKFLNKEADSQCLLWPAKGQEAEGASFCLHGFETGFPHSDPLFPSP